MNKTPKTFDYPVIYPNGIVVYCDSKEQADKLRKNIKKAMRGLKA